MPIVTSGATDVAYETRGEGSPMVLIHGAGGSAQTNWDVVAGSLAKHFRVVMPDYAGSGTTTIPQQDVDLSEIVAQVAAVIAEEADQGAHVVGFSLGAVVAAMLARDLADKAWSLTLIAGWARSDARMRIQFGLWEHLVSQDPDAAATHLLLTGHSNRVLGSASIDELREWIRATSSGIPAGMTYQADLASRIDILPMLSEVKVPTQVIGLTQDNMVPVAHARELHAAIPGAEYLEIDGGHLVLAEQPGDIADVIREFARDHDVDPSSNRTHHDEGVRT